MAQNRTEQNSSCFFLALIAKVKCNPLFFFAVSSALLPQSSGLPFHSLFAPICFFPMLIPHSFWMANAFSCICRHIHNPYATNVRSSGIRDSLHVCVCVCHYGVHTPTHTHLQPIRVPVACESFNFCYISYLIFFCIFACTL